MIKFVLRLMMGWDSFVFGILGLSGSKNLRTFITCNAKNKTKQKQKKRECCLEILSRGFADQQTIDNNLTKP